MIFNDQTLSPLALEQGLKALQEQIRSRSSAEYKPPTFFVSPTQYRDWYSKRGGMMRMIKGRWPTKAEKREYFGIPPKIYDGKRLPRKMKRVSRD